MVLARVVGFGALGCFYAGRLANLAVYALLCWLALRNCRRYKPVFLAVMLLPLSLYIGASCNLRRPDAGLLLFNCQLFLCGRDPKQRFGGIPGIVLC